jgi:hypothetical protein
MGSAACEHSSQLETKSSMPALTIVVPPDVAVRYVEELRMAILAAEIDPVALEHRDRDRLLGSDLHLANGVHRGSDHHAASTPERVPVIPECGVSQA